VRKFILLFLLVASVAAFAGCQSSADKVSHNLSTEAEKFNVQRRIVGINGITDKVEFMVEGRCSLEYGASMAKTLDVICKQGPHDYKKHYIGLSDNMFFISTQLKGLDVSEYHTKIVLKPENIVPDFDLVSGETP
jgi:hypothetical protein